MAAQHASAADIDYLNSLIREEVAAGEDPHRLADINVEMHRCIYRAANNQYLARLLRLVQDEINQLRGTTFSWPGRAKLGLAEHRAMVRAIASKDQDAAENAARHHIREGLRTRLQLIRRETQSRS